METLFNMCSPIPFEYHVSNSLEIEKSIYPKRTVEHLELELIEDGSGEIMVDDEVFATVPHSIHFRYPGMVVQGKGKYKSRFISFGFNEEIFFTQRFDLIPKFTQFVDCEEISSIFDDVFEDYYRENSMRKLRFKILILSLFEKIIYQSQQNYSNKKYDKVLKSINYINSNFKEKISIENLSKLSGYSEFHFIRVFEKCTNKTPTEYINNCRLKHAKKLLVETDDNMESIAEKCGFNSYSYFSKIFKNNFSLSPNTYRKNHRLKFYN